MTPRARLSLGVVGIAVAATLVAAQSKDPFVGTWTLNLAKSKYNSGGAPKSSETLIEPAGKGYKLTVKQVSASGAQLNWSFTSDLDGKASKVTGNSPNADMVTVTRVSATELLTISSKGGKETTRQKTVVSADGKTRTVTTTGVDPTGKKVDTVAVYDKK